ncbi:MAG: NAD(P)-binding protein, partial [Akkermansia sp.]|nr:NAD(P)-binding protein [Akkermansia sp.]
MTLSQKNRRYAVIGAGISGLAIARMLGENGCSVVVFEKENTPGGLVRCERVKGVLYHCVGGHVFNSRNREVLDWFWKLFNKRDFELAIRHAVVSLADGSRVDYPIENHLYQMPEEMRNKVLDDLLQIVQTGYPED